MTLRFARDKLMALQYVQIPIEHHQTQLEESGTAASQTLASSENTVNSMDRAPISNGQLLIPRKPVGSQGMGRSQQSSSKLQSTAVRARGAQIFKNWWMEISACFLFNTALAAIIATLYPHQERPLPEWPHTLSVNTLVSIYVVVLEGTILLVTTEGLGQLKWRWLQDNRPLGDLVNYDEATRNPIGAVTLLWRLRSRHPLSSIGALVTLIVLLVDPFTQQIIHYYDCSIPMRELQATVPQTNVYLPRDRKFVVEPGLRTAITNRILLPNEVTSLRTGCLTGNCTFTKEYGTLGYCSSCTDVTNDLTINTTIAKSEETNFIGHVPNGVNTNISVSTSLPLGLSVSTKPGIIYNLTAVEVFRQPVGFEDAYGMGLENQYRVEIIIEKQFKLFDPATGNSPVGCSTVAANDTWYCKGYGAASCSLSSCVQTYTSTIEIGELDETRMSISDIVRGS